MAKAGGGLRVALKAPGRRLLAGGGLVNAGFAASSVFVSLFFYVTSGSITEMALYVLGKYVGLTIGFLAVARFFPRTAPKTLFRAGLALSAAFYLALIGLGHEAGGLSIELGLIGGVAAGAYWVGANTLAFDVLSPLERSRYYGFNSAISSALNFVMPLAAGVMIDGIGGETGFVAVFAIALVSFVLAWWAARGLPATGGIGRVRVRRALAVPSPRTDWGRIWLAMSMRGFKQAAGAVGLIVLVALATHSAAAQGEFAAVTAIAGIATSVLAGRVRQSSRGVAMWVGAAGFAAATAILFWHPSFLTLMAYGALTGVVYPWLTVPLAAVVLDVIDGDPAARRRRGEYLLSEEVALNIGRIAAVLLLIVLLTASGPDAAVVTALVAAAVLQLAVAYLGAVSRGARAIGTSRASTRTGRTAAAGGVPKIMVTIASPVRRWVPAGSVRRPVTAGGAPRRGGTPVSGSPRNGP